MNHPLGTIITLSGLHGTGKSTYAKALSEEFKLRSVSAGRLFRQLAQESGFTLLEMTRKAEEDGTFDRTIDNMIAQEAETGNVILDGQLCAWLIQDRPHLAIFLAAPDHIRFERIAARDHLSPDEAKRVTLDREEAEKTRFLKLYGFDITDLSIYHLIVDTNLSPLPTMIITLKNIVRDYIQEKPRR